MLVTLGTLKGFKPSLQNDDADGMKRLWDVFANLSLTGKNRFICTPSIHLEVLYVS